MPHKALKIADLIKKLRDLGNTYEQLSDEARASLMLHDLEAARAALRKRASLVVSLSDLCHHVALPTMDKDVREVLCAELMSASKLAEIVLEGNDFKKLVQLHHKDEKSKNGFFYLADKLEMYILPGALDSKHHKRKQNTTGEKA